MLTSRLDRHASRAHSRARRRYQPAIEQLETRLTPASEVGIDDFRISFTGTEGSTAFAAQSPAIAYNSTGNEYLVVWSGDDFNSGEFEIFGQRVNAATGAPIGGEFRISQMGGTGDVDFDAEAPAVAYNPAGNEYLVVWSGDDTNASVNNAFEIYGQRINAATGAVIGANFRISDMGNNNNDVNFDADTPAVAYSSFRNMYLVVWSGDDDATAVVDELEIFGQLLDASGAPVGTNDFRISNMGPNANTAFAAFSPAIAYNSATDEFLVVWEGETSTEDEFEIFGDRRDALTGNLKGVNDFPISAMGPAGDPNYDAATPAVAYNAVSNEYLVVWQGDDDVAPLINDEFEIFGQRLNDAGGTILPEGFRISNMGFDGTTTSRARNAAVAHDSISNEYLVAWEGDNTTTGEFEIFVQRINAAGIEVDGDLRLSSMGATDGIVDFDAASAAIAYNAGAREYLIVWQGDDDTPPLVNDEFEIYGQRFSPIDSMVSISDATIAEGGNLAFNVTLSGAVPVDTVITFSTADGSATTADADYTAQLSQTLTIPAGATTGTIFIATTADNKVELDEILSVNISAVTASGRTVTVLDGSGTGTLFNDDVATVVIGDAAIAEGGNLLLGVSLSRPLDVDTVITYSTADGSATTGEGDYTAQTGQTLTIPAGATTGTITIVTTADTRVELDETLNVNLSAVTASGRTATILDGSGAGTIGNDDGIPPIAAPLAVAVDVRVGKFKGRTLVDVFVNGVLRRSFYPFGVFPGKVSVSLRDVNGDGLLDIVARAKPSGRPERRIMITRL